VATAMDRILAEAAGAAPLEETMIDDAAGREVFDKVAEPGARERLLRLLSTNPSWRENAALLKTLASVDPVAAGFRPRVRLLADAEWQILHVYLTNRYPVGNQ